MSNVVAKSWRVVRKSDFLKYVILLAAPMFVKPVDFIRGPTQPRYAKIPGWWAAPALAAVLWTKAFSEIFAWISSRDIMNMAVETAPQEKLEIIRSIHQAASSAAIIMLAGVVVSIFGLSIARWGYHSIAVRIFSRWWDELIAPPLKFFVVTTSSWMLWFGAASYGISKALWANGGDIKSLFDGYAEGHPVVVGTVLVLIFIFSQVSTHNSQVGMKAVYAGSKKLLFLVDVVFVLFLVLVGFVALRF